MILDMPEKVGAGSHNQPGTKFPDNANIRNEVRVGMVRDQR